MRLLAVILIGDRTWLVPAALLVVASGLLLWRMYRRLSVSSGVRALAGLLKAAGIALLAICLVEPLWSGTRARPGANLFLMIADNSRSMQIQDSSDLPTRGNSLLRLLGEENSVWQVRLEQDFDVRRYLVDSGVRQTDDFKELDFAGNATSLGKSLITLRERFENRPVAGILLFTDGNATDTTEAQLDLDGLPPVFPVLVGERGNQPDIAVTHVAVSQTSFEDAPVTIRADVSATGLSKPEIVARLLDEENKVVDEISQTMAAGDKSVTFRFQQKSTRTGVAYYRIEVASPGQIGTIDDENNGSREATLENNRRLIKVDRGQGPRRVLYVSGRPNWEFKFLRRAVEDDYQIQLAGLIRIAKREAKFDFRGRVGESSNPLFRGFKKNSDAETERYDEPVLLRLNMKDRNELHAGFPKTAEELYPFHAVILDDVEAGFFTHDQLALLERFVSKRGGGLLMLGGQKSYRNGNYAHTPVADMLPVYLDARPRERKNARYRLMLTREGWLQPWIRLRSNENAERKRIEEMPQFHTSNQIGSIKPGAMVLARIADGAGGEWPALVVQRYGRGRAAALTIGDLWRWGLKRRETESDDLGKAWRQMLRWLVADVPDRIESAVKPAREIAPDAVRLQVRVRDPEYKPLDNAAVAITVKPPEGDSIRLDAEPSLKKPGLYEAVYVPRKAGVHRVDVTVADADGAEIGTSVSGWVADPDEREFATIAPNHELMRQLAERTGGEVVKAENLENFVKGLSARNVPVTEQWTYPLWHQTWVFLLAVSCLVGEWGVRRWKGLP